MITDLLTAGDLALLRTLLLREQKAAQHRLRAVVCSPYPEERMTEASVVRRLKHVGRALTKIRAALAKKAR